MFKGRTIGDPTPGEKPAQCFDLRDLLPTNTCFEDSLMFFVTSIRERPDLKTNIFFALVHGLCGEGEDAYSHGWVEHDGICFEMGLTPTKEKTRVLGALEAGEFYRYNDVRETTKYRWPEFILLGPKYGHMPAPWEEKYRALCTERRKKRVRRRNANPKR